MNPSIHPPVAAPNLNSAFAITIGEVNMEQAYTPNVMILNEEQLEFATTTRFRLARILPEADEYYAK